MTLLELLVKELPKRGGWPKGIEKISQSPIDGELYLFKPCEILTGRGIYFFEVSDLWWIKVYKKQYEAAISSHQPVWNGEGLPPVGVTCEAKYNHSNSSVWFVFECVGVSNGIGFGFADGAAVHAQGNEFTFRPISTEADRKREAEVDELIYAITLTLTDIYASQRFMDAIAAGKIPGVELSK